jgi:alginate O-acetyltransferase complex protein AlgF
MARVHRRSALALAWLAAAALATLAAWAAPPPAEEETGDPDTGDSIYVPSVPAQSAFLRVFNGTTRAIGSVRLGQETLSEIGPFEASSFAVVPPGPYTLALNGAKQTFRLESNRYYTAALTPGGLRLLPNERNGNRMKALIVLYNLLDGEVSLRTADGRTTVVDNVAPKAKGTREVNAVRAQLALYRGGDRLTALAPMVLERGRAFHLFVAGSPDQPVPVWVVN